MKTVTKTVAKLTPEEYRACQYLNLRGNGMMMYSLIDNRDSERSHAIMVWDAGRLIGWALLIPHGDDNSWHSTAYQKKMSRFIAQIYVRSTHRRKGIGSLLMCEIIKLDPRPTVIPHDATSASFYADYDVVTEVYRRGMLTQAKKAKRKAA